MGFIMMCSCVNRGYIQVGDGWMLRKKKAVVGGDAGGLMVK